MPNCSGLFSKDILKMYKSHTRNPLKTGLVDISHVLEMGHVLLQLKQFQACGYEIEFDYDLIELIKCSLVMSDSAALEVSRSWEP
jgi:hypothetical protein